MRSTAMSFLRRRARLLLALGGAVLVFTGAARACEMPPPPCPGAMFACPVDDNIPAAFCPLEHTDVRAEIAGDIARVTVTQRFRNTLGSAIEAIYTFPLSEKGAVDRMQMKIGDRTITGKVKEREEARRDYERARHEGRTAALLDQERPNIFTQSVANVQPGDVIEVNISYVEYLKHEADDYEFSFPMTVGPRYMPGGPLPGGAGTTQTPDAGKISPPLTPEGTRAGHDVSLEVVLDAGMPLGDLKSELHKVAIDRPSEARAVVRLENQKELPNRDFVLKYSVRGAGIREGVLTHRDKRGGYFTLWLQPPAEAAPEESVAKELIFVIDCSGSMGGFPLAKAKDTMAQCIQDLSPRDTFNLISFAGGTGYCFNETKTANEENKRAALRYLENLQGGGGTEMMGAVQAALAGPYAKDRLRTICFMTDGFIGNDMAILDTIRRGAPYARVFSFGIGNSVNRFLIEGMAREGRGAAEIVTLESGGADAVKRFSARIKRPVLTNISVEFSGVEGADLCPPLEALPDLFAGQPLRITGRYGRAGKGAIIVRGETASGPFERKIAVEFPGSEPAHDSLASLWARQRVEALMATGWQGIQEGRPAPDLKQQIIALGTEYSLVTQFTSFIAVDDSRRRSDGKPVHISVPVEMPDGVSYDGIVGNAGSKMRTGGAGSAPGIMALQSAPAPVPPAPMLMRAAPAAAEAKAEAAPTPAPSMKKSQELKDVQKESDAAKGSSKLDPALRRLAARLVNGAYTGEGLQVTNNQVEVAVYLRDVGDAALAALRALGAEVRSVSHAAAKALVRVNVADLEKLAALDAVLRIAPPSR